jgi:hypothetical protein
MSLFFWPAAGFLTVGKMLWRTTLEQTETESATPDDSGFVPYDMWFHTSVETPNPESGQKVESIWQCGADLGRIVVND